jgi:hypothetical protein
MPLFWSDLKEKILKIIFFPIWFFSLFCLAYKNLPHMPFYGVLKGFLIFLLSLKENKSVSMKNGEQLKNGKKFALHFFWLHVNFIISFAKWLYLEVHFLQKWLNSEPWTILKQSWYFRLSRPYEQYFVQTKTIFQC